MVKKNTCVFISGQGSNLRNLIFHSRDDKFPVKISLVISNNKKAFGINNLVFPKFSYYHSSSVCSALHIVIGIGIALPCHTLHHLLL